MSAPAPVMLTFLQEPDKLREIVKVESLILLTTGRSFSLALPYPFPVKDKKNPLHKCELLFKDCESLVFLVSADCDRIQEQVDHSLHPSDSYCYFERADICWRVERGSIQRNDESPVLDCSERGPHEWMKTWQKGWKRRKKVLSNESHLFCRVFYYFKL